MKKLSDYALAAISFLKGFKDVVAALVVIILLLAFFSDSVRTQFGLFIARNYGLKAFAYYEVDARGYMTEPLPNAKKRDSCGRFMLLRSDGGRQYSEI